MGIFQWEGITQFIFPEHVGSIEEVLSVNITPKWEQQEFNESLRLMGIYHIQSEIRFNSQSLPNYSEGILIEHLQFNGNEGYFEYAYPLEVDLPKEMIGNRKPILEVSNVQFFVLDGSCCTFRWDVQCKFEDDEKTDSLENSIRRFHQSIPINEEQETSPEIKVDEEKNLPEHGIESTIISPFERIAAKLIEQEEPLIVQEGTIEIHEQNQLENPVTIQQINEITEGQPLLEKEYRNDEEPDDFLESLREDYTIFSRSNNIL